MIEVPALMVSPELRHGFFTRRGGCSTGIYDSLNCGLGSGDERAYVERNRAHVATSLGMMPQALVTGYQTHSSDVAVIDQLPDEAPRADALVTASTGIAIGVLTADCAPVLFADRDGQIVAAAHAGWRGALEGILDATVSAMEQLGAIRGQIVAAIGPAIHQAAYEVGAEFRDHFIEAEASNARLFIASDREAHFRFDLPAYCEYRLSRLGLAHVAGSENCTYDDESDFFSYRRATHRGEPDYGRQISAIALGPAGVGLD
ncbi:MAG: peptidoglycan editing factor PgeF [Rhizobiales bacterium]|nr:peptidoglycan editing factor PgeF [Hyphomicrobiales bacterium]